MTRVLITYPTSAINDAKNVERLVIDARCSCDLKLREAEEISSVLCGDFDIILILIGSEVYSKNFEEKIDECAKAGVFVVGVWVKSLVKAPAPAVIAKLGRSQVLQSPADISAVVCDAEVIWKDPDGNPRAVPPLKRNKC